MNTPQQQAIADTQVMQQNLVALLSIYTSLKALNDRYNGLQYSATWAALQTAPLLPDGSISETPDSVPNTSHPIVVGGVNKAQVTLVSGIVMAQQVIALMEGNAVTPGNYKQTVESLM